MIAKRIELEIISDIFEKLETNLTISSISIHFKISFHQNAYVVCCFRNSNMNARFFFACEANGEICSISPMDVCPDRWFSDY